MFGYNEYAKNIAGSNRDGAAVSVAPACISAISETHINLSNHIGDLKPDIVQDSREYFPGYQLHVYPLYTEFKSKDCLEPVKKAEDLKYDTSYDIPLHIRKKRQEKKDGMTYQRFEEPDQYEKRLHANAQKKGSKDIPKRGRVTGMSKKSSIRLRKRAAQIEDLAIWIDFTFADDVMVNKSISERAKFSYYCLKRLTKYVKDTFGMYLIWKREYKPRKSGKNEGEIIPHFHVLFGGMSQKQYSNWWVICVQILVRWVQITGTDNDNAMSVAINRKSYRRIENPKHATCYISKYFSKDEPLDLPEGESIGRCWGKSKNCPKVSPWIINLNQEQSFKLVRHLIRKKKLRGKKGRFIKRQLQKGYATFLFEDEVDIGRFLNFIDVVMFPDASPIPF